MPDRPCSIQFSSPFEIVINSAGILPLPAITIIITVVIIIVLVQYEAIECPAGMAYRSVAVTRVISSLRLATDVCGVWVEGPRQ